MPFQGSETINTGTQAAAKPKTVAPDILEANHRANTAVFEDRVVDVPQHS